MLELETRLSEATFAFLDVDTTGISTRKGGRICEIAIIRTRGGKEIDAWDSLVHPGRPIPAVVTNIHGINDVMVEDSPRFEGVSAQVGEMLEDAAIVCHNAPFDIGFVTYEMAQAGLDLPRAPVVDTLVLARRHFSFPKNNMGVIAQSLGIEQKNWHRALADVRTTSEIFHRMVNSFADLGVETLVDLLALQKKSR